MQHTETDTAIPPAEVPEVELYHPQELVDDLRLLAGRQDHRAAVFRHRDRHRPGRAGALLADAAAARLSRHLRLHHARGLLPVHHHARHDHGGLPADRALPRRLRQLPDPADGRRPGHGVPLRQHAQLLDLPAGGAGAGRELLRAGRPDRGGLDALPAAGDPLRHARRPAGRHHPDARLADALHHRLHHGRAELRGDRAAGPHPRHDADAHAADGLGHLHRHRHGAAGLPGAVRRLRDDAVRPAARHQLLHAGAGRDGRAAQLRRRQPDPVPAPVLVLRPPGGLHRRAARLRHRLGPDLACTRARTSSATA